MSTTTVLLLTTTVLHTEPMLAASDIAEGANYYSTTTDYYVNAYFVCIVGIAGLSIPVGKIFMVFMR